MTNENGEDFHSVSAILVCKDSLEIKIPENLKPDFNYRFKVFSNSPNLYSFPTESIQVKESGEIKLSTPNPFINLGDHAELKIEMTGNGPWDFSLSNGNTFENITTPEFSVYVSPENSSSFKILSPKNECAYEIDYSKVTIQVVQPNIKIDESFKTELCKNNTIQIPISGLNVNHINQYKVILEGESKSFKVQTFVTALSINFNLPQEIEGEGLYKLKIQGLGLGDFSLYKNVKIKTSPPQPKIISPIKYCHNAPAGKLNTEGSNLKWYYGSLDKNSYSEIIPNTAKGGLQFYYVSKTSINGCESERSKIEIVIKSPVSTNISGDNTIISSDSTKLKTV
jgi:hypothetical protein